VIGGRQLVVDRDTKNADAADPLDAWAWSGRLADFPRLPRPLITISFVFPLFNFKLFCAAQMLICSISWHRVLEFAVGTTR